MNADFQRTDIAVGMLVLCALVWGSNVVVGRAVHAELPPVGFAFWRNAIALAVVLPFASRAIAPWPPIRRQVGMLIAAGVIGTALFNAVLYAALGTTTAINGALMMSLCPVVVPAMAFFLVGERLVPRQALGIAASLTGVGVIMARGDLAVLTSLSILPGDLLMFFAMLCWSFYTVLVKRKPNDLAPAAFLAVILSVAVVALLPFYLWETWTERAMPLSREAVLASAYVGIFPTALALLVFNRAVLVLGANRAALFNHLVPVFATLLAIAFLGERPALFHLAGAGLIGLGLFLNTAPRTAGPAEGKTAA